MDRRIAMGAALTLFLLCTGVARAQYKQVNDIRYTESNDPYAQERCKLDVYYPTDQQDAPVVVWFHGGGIEGGEKHIDPQLKNSGLVVVAPNYRLLPKAPIDDILDDAAAAVAWTYKNISKYGGSKRKIFVAGHSAGGYLLDLIGLDKKWLAKYGVDADSLAALVPFSGQCITHYNIRKQQGISPLQATIDQYAPLTYVRADAPPIVIISGDRELELFGRYEEQAYFWRMLKLAGHKDVTLYEMQGYDHGAMPQPAYKILKDHIKRIVAAMAQGTEINSRDLRGKVVYQDDEVVFRQLDERTWIGNGHRVYNESLYLVEGNDRALLIDAGTYIPELDKIVAKITSKPVTMMLTHAHGDHAGGVGPFPEVYLNAGDMTIVPNSMRNYKGQIKYLSDGEVIDLGGREIEVLFTPGHTAGSTTFFDKARHYGFSGDTFGSTNLLVFTNLSTEMHTAERIERYMKKNDIRFLFPGHYSGDNLESLQRVADIKDMCREILDGERKPTASNGNNGGMDMMVDDKGVRINFSSRFGMK